MANRVVVQPNGLYARFSEVVDNFTHINLTREQMVAEYAHIGRLESEEKVARAEAATGRFEDELRVVRAIHGEAEAETMRRLMTEAHHVDR